MYYVNFGMSFIKTKKRKHVGQINMYRTLELGFPPWEGLVIKECGVAFVVHKILEYNRDEGLFRVSVRAAGGFERCSVFDVIDAFTESGWLIDNWTGGRIPERFKPFVIPEDKE